MKKVLTFLVILVIAVAVVALLFYNKSKNVAKQKINVIQTTFPVSTITVNKQKFDEKLSMVGITYANSETTINSEIQGRITAVYINVGDRVSAGKVVAKVDDELKKAALINAQANYDKAKKDLERNEQLASDKSISDAQLDAAKLTYKMTESQLIIAKRQLADAEIKSPISGIITSKTVEVGNFVNVGNPIANIIDISILKIKVNVAENEVFKLKVNDVVSITTDVYQDVTFTGRIKNISAKGDEAHTYPIEITLPNSIKYPIKAGMFVRVTFMSLDKGESIYIPREALIGTARNPQVFVVSNNIAYLKNVVIGNEFGNFLEVTKGLNAGDVIVTNGQLNLKDNVAVQIIK
ncbi:MAG: efflux RND transporter periplasmic adaptor subunit [FCB group bacterium]|jgi:RND family efflux transporter MFP subunit